MVVVFACGSKEEGLKNEGDASSSDAASDLCVGWTKPPNGTCEPLSQCGCAKDEYCIFLTLDGETGCVKAGSAAENHACDSPTACQRGLQCVSKVCHRNCKIIGD